MLVELSYTNKEKAQVSVIPKSQKENYKVDRGAPTDKKTSLQLVFCGLRKRSQKAQQGSKTSKWK